MHWASFGHLLVSPCDCEGQSWVVVRGLVEHFWDSTNTFHLPFGEMAITPLDMSMIIGVEFSGDTVSMLTTIPPEEFMGLFGPVGEGMQGPLFALTSVASAILAPSTDTLPMQLARLFLFYLVNSTILSKSGSRGHMTIAWDFQDIDRVSRYDWGVTAYSTLISYRSSASRAKVASPILAGY